MFCVQVSTANIPVDVVMQVVSIIIALTSTNSEHFVYLCCMVISLWCFDMLKSWHWVHAGTSNAHCRVTVFLPLCNKQLIAKLLFWIMKKLQCCGSFPCHIRWFHVSLHHSMVICALATDNFLHSCVAKLSESAVVLNPVAHTDDWWLFDVASRIQNRNSKRVALTCFMAADMPLMPR